MRAPARCGFGDGVGPGMLFGVALITLGTLLFIDNLQIFPIEIAGAFWPLVLTSCGAACYLRSRSVAVRVWAATAVFAGILLILSALHVIHVTMGTLWPLALIATGIVMLIYRLRWREFTNRFSVGSSAESRSSSGRLQEYAFFSSVKRRIETPNFEGGEVSSVFGGIELDLRWSGISTPDRQAVLEANSVFGAVEMRIPETWRVSLQGQAVFGAYEDKTVPPRPEPGIILPTLIIRGGSAFGAVTIRN
jgi:predicted membrane protein